MGDMADDIERRVDIEREEDDQRDYAEELDNAMTPFRENCEKVADRGWNMDTLLKLFNDDSNNVWRETTVAFDDGNYLLLNTNLVEAPDGILWRVLE